MLALLLAAAASLSCPVEQAHYVMRATPGVTADFRPIDSGADWPSGLAFRLHIGASGRSYWFLPWGGGSDGRQNLASTIDVDMPGWRPPSPDGGPRPVGDVAYIATDTTYHLIDRIPHRGDIAPAHILLPDLRDALWYRTPPDRRDSTPRQFFDLTACRRDSR